MLDRAVCSQTIVILKPGTKPCLPYSGLVILQMTSEKFWNSETLFDNSPSWSNTFQKLWTVCPPFSNSQFTEVYSKEANLIQGN